MNVGGINSLGFFPQAKPASGKASEKEATSSFADLLGQASGDDSADTTDVQAESAQATNQTSGQGLPSAPTPPTLDVPFNGDRMFTGKAPVLVTPANKDPQAPIADEAVNSLTKRVVWNDFLRKMKDELGVSADDVLNAFTSLSPEDLAKPPAQSLDKVVMALGLDGQQAMMAKQYFTELINKTQPKSLGEELASSEKQISLTLMSQRELDRKNAQKSVDRMQQSFFLNGAYARPATPATAPVMAPNLAAAAQATPSAAKPVTEQSLPDLAAMSQPNPTEFSEAAYDSEAPAFAPNPMMPAAASAQAKPSSVRIDDGKMNEALAKMQPADSPEIRKADVDSVIKKFMSGQAQSAIAPQAAPMAAAQAAPVMTAAPQVATDTAQAAQSAQAALNSILSKVASMRPQTDSQSSDENDSTSDASYLGATLAHDAGQANGLKAPTEFQNQLRAEGAPQPMAVPDLVQNAKVMVRDGGGEMKVTLKPEGLGEVAMKVSVHEGKVNVQMITESDEAKKLIERQLGELKASLTGQHLHVETIKIDTATNLGRQMEQQYQDAQRQMAQQTLEQFRQDHQGWRRSFFEVPGAKVYKDQNDAPRDIRGPSASSKRSSNRRLDLVA